MSSSRLIRRWWRRGPSAPTSTLASPRVEVRPPALWGQAEPVWHGLWRWLRSGRVEDAAAGALDQACADFVSTLQDLDVAGATDLRQRAGHARSLRELWHLRAELYSLIARHVGQSQADVRLATVNRHFPLGAHGVGTAPSSARHGSRQAS